MSNAKEEDLKLDETDAAAEEGGEEGAAKKKDAGLSALLPNLLKFAAIGVGALIFIVTVCVITYTILNKGGRSQTVVPTSTAWVGARQQYSMFTAIGIVRTTTQDADPYTVVVDMVIAYDLNDNAAATELTGRLYELRDFVRSYFRSKSYVELEPDNEARLKQEIVEPLNTRLLNTAKARNILFNQLDVMKI